MSMKRYALEPAAIEGRVPPEPSEPDYEDAKRELSGEPEDEKRKGKTKRPRAQLSAIRGRLLRVVRQ